LAAQLAGAVRHTSLHDGIAGKPLAANITRRDGTILVADAITAPLPVQDASIGDVDNLESTVPEADRLFSHRESEIFE
jgi:hypothetical protein